MKVLSKSAQIRAALKKGKDPKEVAKELGVSINRVYTVRWEMKKKKVVLSKRDVEIANKLAVPLGIYAKEKARLNKGRLLTAVPREPETKVVAPKFSPVLESYKDDLSYVESQINRFCNIAAYLSLRIEQMEQNDKWEMDQK